MKPVAAAATVLVLASPFTGAGEAPATSATGAQRTASAGGSQTMRITRSGTQPSQKGTADHFTGAVGLLGVLSARQVGAERIIAMSRHPSRQKLAREFGATDIVTERGDEGVARIMELTRGVGADAVLECVGTPEAMQQAIRSTRPGGTVGYVGVPHGVQLDAQALFFVHVRLFGGPAPVRRYLPMLIELVLKRKIDPGKVFDLTLPLDQVAEGYRAMDERRAIKTLLRP